ncbi:DNA internalization-related competence protein ComEC/Rec2, partial [bacterium]|nr:DNA internalization-related competence protein ComEC/Rec2 [bacterium]
VPAVKIALLFALGIIMGDRLLHIDPFLFTGIAAVMLVAGIVFLPRPWSIVPLSIGLLLLGIVAGNRSQSVSSDLQKLTRQNLVIGGEIRSLEYRIDSRAVYLFRTTWISEDGEHLQPHRSLVRLITESSKDTFSEGTQQLLYGRIESYPERRNPGGRDLKKEFGRRQIIGWIKPDRMITTGLATVAVSPASTIRKIIGNLLPQQEAALLTGMILGDKNALSEEVRDNFRQSGLYHLLAVSGLHIGFLFVILMLFVRFIAFRLAVRRLILFAGLWAYVWITGANPPTLRAALMLTLILLSFPLRRVPIRWNLLASAALIILLFAPAHLFKVGFQLSFLAATGVLLAIEVWERRSTCQADIPQKSLPYSNFLTEYLFKPLSISLSVTIFTAPLLIYYFGGYAPIAILLNVIAVPVAGLVFALTWAAIFLNLLTGLLLPALNGAIELGLKILESLAAWGASAPGNALNSYGGLPVSILILTLFLLTIFASSWRRRILLGVGGLVIFLLLPFLTVSPYLRLDCFDVGQGDSALITFPGGGNVMIDCGSAEAAEYELIPSLKNRNIHRINNLVLSHFDTDHAGGAEAILQHFQVDRLVMTAPHTEDPLGKRIIHQAQTAGIPVAVKYLGDTLDFYPASKCLALWPSSPCDGSENQHSLVLKLTYHNTDLLFTGDIGFKEERRLKQAGDYLDSEFLKIPHHGSKYSSYKAFLETVTPEFAFISAGRNNPFGHPANRVLYDLNELNVTVHRTDKHKAAVYLSDGNSIWPVQWK